VKGKEKIEKKKQKRKGKIGNTRNKNKKAYLGQPTPTWGVCGA
jgi:hypothetical protein